MTLANWVKIWQTGKPGEIGKTQRPLTEIELEFVKTKRELAEVKMVRDLLKNGGVLCQGGAVKYAMLKELQRDFRHLS